MQPYPARRAAAGARPGQEGAAGRPLTAGPADRTPRVFGCIGWAGRQGASQASSRAATTACSSVMIGPPAPRPRARGRRRPGSPAPGGARGGPARRDCAAPAQGVLLAAAPASRAARAAGPRRRRAPRSARARRRSPRGRATRASGPTLAERPGPGVVALGEGERPPRADVDGSAAAGRALRRHRRLERPRSGEVALLDRQVDRPHRAAFPGGRGAPPRTGRGRARGRPRPAPPAPR